MTATKVLAGNPTGKMPVCNDFFDCFYALDLPEGSISGRRVVGGSISNNLNTLVDMAIDEGCTHLFIVEDDSLFGRDTVMRLLAHDVPVVAGLCRSRAMPFRSYVYSGIDGDEGLTYYTLKPTDKGLIRCAATGMGGILINTEVFKKLKKPYFQTYFAGTKEWTQDIVFGKSLIDAGIDVYCDLGVTIGHVTQCVLGSALGPDGWNIVLRVHSAIVNIPQPEV